MSASTTVPSSSPPPSPTGVGSTGPGRSSSTRARRGRTPGSNRSTGASETSSSTAPSSTRCSKPKSSPRTGGSTTTATVRTRPSTASAPASTPRRGPPETNPNSHRSWTTQRGPLTPGEPGGGLSEPTLRGGAWRPLRSGAILFWVPVRGPILPKPGRCPESALWPVRWSVMRAGPAPIARRRTLLLVAVARAPAALPNGNPGSQQIPVDHGSVTPRFSTPVVSPSSTYRCRSHPSLTNGR